MIDVKRCFAALLLASAAACAMAQQVQWSTVHRGSTRAGMNPNCSDLPHTATRSLAVAANGDVVVTGCAVSLDQREDIATVRYSGTTGAVIWRAAYTGKIRDDDGGFAVAIDAAGDVVITGTSQDSYEDDLDIRTIKYDGATGAERWSVVQSGAYDGRGYAIATSAAGDVFVTGQDGDGRSLRTIKYDGATGIVRWSVAYAASPSSSYGEGTSIAVDANGDAYVTGITGGSYLFRTVKFSGATGSVLWATAIDEDRSGVGRRVVIGPDGNPIAAGFTYDFGTVFVKDYRVVKYDAATGTILWDARVTGPGQLENTANGMALNAAGDVYVTGSSYQSCLSSGGCVCTGIECSYIIRTAKISHANGAVLWDVIEPWTEFYGDGYSVAVDAAGDAVVTGVRLAPATGATPPRPDIATFKYRGSDGAKLWTADSSVAPLMMEGTAVAFDAQGNVLLVGRGFETDVYGRHLYVTKMAGATGARLWIASEPAVPGDSRLQTHSISQPRGGRIAMMTQGAVASGVGAYAVLLDAASGLMLWSRELPGIAPEGQTNARIAIDAAGDVLVGGRMEGSIGVTKLAGATGEPLWATLHDPANYSGDVFALVLDGAGQVLVTSMACSRSSGSCDRWLTLKLDAATGTELWAGVQGGVSGSNYPPKAMAVDSAGNVLVTGATGSGSVRTVKYSGASGAELWNVLTPTAQRLGEAQAVAVDAQGNAVVLAQGSPSIFEVLLRLIKYDGATGAVSWEVAYPGLTGSNLVVDSESGDAVITLGNSASWRTIRHYAATGAVAWNRAYLPQGTVANRAHRALAFDSRGNVVAAGFTQQVAGVPSERRVVAYHGPSGFPLWELSVPHPAGPGYASAVVTDGADGIYIGATLTEAGRPEAALLAKITGGPVAPPNLDAVNFNADDRSDIVWSHGDGRAAIWLMNGMTPIATQELIGAGSGWSIAHVADLDGDGKGDLVWKHSDGRTAVYFMDGATPSFTRQVPASIPGGVMGSSNWTVVATPDLHGDGKASLLFRNDLDGSVKAVRFGRASQETSGYLGLPGSGWTPAIAADFDGDRKDDILWTHDDGRVDIRLMDGMTERSRTQVLNAGTGWSVARTADLDGDGKADIVWRHTDGSVALWLMNGAAMASGAGLLGPGTGWSVTHTGDFDGDGKADILFTHTDGRVAIYLMNGLVPKEMRQVLNAGSGWSVARLADLDGDAKADILWRHADGRVAAWLMNGTVYRGGGDILGAGTGWGVKALPQ